MAGAVLKEREAGMCGRVCARVCVCETRSALLLPILDVAFVDEFRMHAYRLCFIETMGL